VSCLKNFLSATHATATMASDEKTLTRPTSDMSKPNVRSNHYSSCMMLRFDKVECPDEMLFGSVINTFPSCGFALMVDIEGGLLGFVVWLDS